MSADGILIAGAGIGGLTAALALARQGRKVTVFDQAARLEEAGAGIQLAPNATRILIALGLEGRLEAGIVSPDAIRLRSGSAGRDIAVLPLGEAARQRYGAPYWVIHRADLQNALAHAVADEPGIALTLGAALDRFAACDHGVRVRLRPCGPGTAAAVEGALLIGADGLWSRLRVLVGDAAAPRFAGRCAFRAIVPAAALARGGVEPVVDVWLGEGAHVVSYPVRSGAAVNIVAVAGGGWRNTGWSTGAGPEEVLARFPAASWTPAVRRLLAAPQRWQKWALYDRAPLRAWGHGPVTLLGDAAHPMLPFLAQGAAMAIEDAAVLARELATSPLDLIAALRRYEAHRAPRTAHVQRAARRGDLQYHLRQPAAGLRNAVLRVLGGRRLLAHYDWIYQWRA